MSDRDLEEKFRSLTDGILGAAQSDRVIELCWRIAELDDAGELGDAPPSRRIRLIDHHDAPPFVCSGDTRCP